MPITDPTFYLVAIPAVFLLGVSKSGFGAGFGSLAVPLMALAVPVPQAAAILVPVLLVLDLIGLHAWRRHFDWTVIRFLLPFGLLGTAIGTLLFSALDARLVAGIVGAFTLLFLAQRLLFPPRADAPPPARWWGGLMTTIAGFTSFVAHAGGPPLNAYMLPLKLRPPVYTASIAMFFFTINVAKWGPYAWLGLLDLRNMATSLALLPLSPLGVLLGVRIAHRISQVLFYRLIHAGMLLTGAKLVWDGFLSARM
ncbi:sulfite exporter TauE/SafE family protein [Ramlibacter sp. AN1015]|uniref:sulfite exporter TauE/SafE family protein n=1 Tax=Ramlibacter sp. AN1015 TaxID=3133428 RepID=UPI0030BCFAD2